MPMDFPDLNSLRFDAKIHDFRDIGSGEPQEEFCIALADHVASRDFIESEEIRFKIGWDRWSFDQKTNMLRKQGMNI